MQKDRGAEPSLVLLAAWAELLSTSAQVCQV